MNVESAKEGREVCMKEMVLYYAPENAVQFLFIAHEYK